MLSPEVGPFPSSSLATLGPTVHFRKRERIVNPGCLVRAAPLGILWLETRVPFLLICSPLFGVAILGSGMPSLHRETLALSGGGVRDTWLV